MNIWWLIIICLTIIICVTEIAEAFKEKYKNQNKKEDIKEWVKQLQDNLYKEIWIITGYKGGYETYKDFGNHLIKRIELKEE